MTPLVRLLNPMVAEESALRGDLLPGLLGTARHNAGHRQPWLRLFEMGDVFALPRETAQSKSASELGVPPRTAVPPGAGAACRQPPRRCRQGLSTWPVSATAVPDGNAEGPVAGRRTDVPGDELAAGGTSAEPGGRLAG